METVFVILHHATLPSNPDNLFENENFPCTIFISNKKSSLFLRINLQRKMFSHLQKSTSASFSLPISMLVVLGPPAFIIAPYAVE